MRPPRADRRRFVAQLAAGAFALAAAPSVRPQGRQPIRLIVPFAQGGTADRVAREVAGTLGRHLDSPIDVVNVLGNHGIAAMDEVAAAPPDGRTLGLANSTPIIVATLLKRQRTYDVFRDLTWVAIFGTYPNAVVVRSKEPITLQQWIARVKAERKPVHYATVGEGSGGHLAGEYLRQTYGVDLVHETYPALPEAYPRLDDGTIGLVFDGVPSALALAGASATRRVVAVTSERRHASLPNATAFGEIGARQTFVIWAGLVAPPRLPESERVPLFRAALATVGDPQLRARLVDIGVDPAQLVGKAAVDFVEQDFIRSAALLASLPAPAR